MDLSLRRSWDFVSMLLEENISLKDFYYSVSYQSVWKIRNNLLETFSLGVFF